MIRFLWGTELSNHPDLCADMFRDRTLQFHERLGWDVRVDALGWETDGYDALDPLYVIVEDGGTHLGSMRFLPTTGPTMLADAFPHLSDHPIRAPRIWEATRFCLAPTAPAGTARLLMLGASELGLGLGLDHAVGVFDASMLRVYRRLGWPPRILGQRDGIAAGLWTFTDGTHDRLLAACDLPARTPRRWFEATFGDVTAGAPLPTRA